MSFTEKLLELHNGANEIQKAFTVDAKTSTAVHLSATEANEFIDKIRDKSAVLGVIRTINIPRPNYSIHKILGQGRVLRAIDQKPDDTNGYKVKPETIRLSVVGFRGHFDITDDELKDNITGEELTNTLLNHTTKAIANDLMSIVFHADKTGGKSGADAVLNEMDGVFKKLKTANAPVIDASTMNGGKVSREIFRKAIKSLDTGYRSDAEFFVHDDIMIDYNSLFDDSYNRKEFIQNIAGKKANITDALEPNESGEYTSLLTHPKNIILAIQGGDNAISFEAERRAGDRMTRYHFSIFIDVAVEDPTACVQVQKIKSL